MALSERMQAHEANKPQQGTQEMVKWLAEQAQIRAEERPKGKTTGGRRWDPGGEQERLKEAARKKAEKAAKKKARHEKTRADQKARAEKAQQEAAERKSRRENNKKSPWYRGGPATAKGTTSNQGQPGSSLGQLGADAGVMGTESLGGDMTGDYMGSSDRGGGPANSGPSLSDRMIGGSSPWLDSLGAGGDVGAAGAIGPGSSLGQLGADAGVMGDPGTAGAMGDPGDPGLKYELSGPTGRTDMGPAQDFQFGSPRLGEPLPTNQEFRGPQPESAANFPPEYVPAPDDPRMRMNAEYGEIRTPLPADPSLVGGTIQQGTTRTDPLTGQQTDFPGPTEPLMVSPITPEEFGAGMPPQMPPVIPGGFDPLEGPAMPMDPMQGAVPEAMPEYGAMAPLGMEDLPPTPRLPQLADLASARADIQSGGSGEIAAQLAEEAARSQARDEIVNQNMINRGGLAPGVPAELAGTTAGEAMSQSEWGHGPPASRGGYGPTYGAHENTWFPPDHPGMQRPAPATVPEPQVVQPASLLEEMSPVLPPRLEPELRGLMNKAQTPSAFGGSAQSQAYRDMFPNRQNSLAGLSASAGMPDPSNTGTSAGPGLGGGVRTHAPKTTRFNV